jgi:hypothetical protein
MAVSIAQYVDLLFKKLQGVAKTANSTAKGASNESIASPPLLRGDVVWTEAYQIANTAQVISGITTAWTAGNSVQCAPDTTVAPIGGIRPTWLTNKNYWIPQEFGSTWLPKVFVGPASAANIESTGTQIFSAGIGGVGEYFFDTQAGVLNFIGETIPTVLTAGNVIYVSGYTYSGLIGTTNLPGGTTIGNLVIANTTITTNQVSGNIILAPQGNVDVSNVHISNVAGPVSNTDATTKGYVDSAIGNVTSLFGNIIFSNTTISTSYSPGNITITPTGNSEVIIDTNSGLVLPVGNISQRPSPALTGTLRFNAETGRVEVYDGSQWDDVGSDIKNQVIYPDGITDTYSLDQTTTAPAILVSTNGVVQIPVIAYTVTGNSITFAEVPLTTDIIDVRFL